ADPDLSELDSERTGADIQRVKEAALRIRHQLHHDVLSQRIRDGIAVDTRDLAGGAVDLAGKKSVGFEVDHAKDKTAGRYWSRCWGGGGRGRCRGRRRRCGGGRDCSVDLDPAASCQYRQQNNQYETRESMFHGTHREVSRPISRANAAPGEFGVL